MKNCVKLSPQQIDALLPGQELDKLIASHVMGWTLKDHVFGDDLPGGPFRAIAITEDGAHSSEIPQYSRYISQAWEVAERMCFWEDKSDTDFFNNELEFIAPLHSMDSYKASLAICKSALKAVMR